MHTVTRILFGRLLLGLCCLLVFSIGCQKNPSGVRATKNAAGKCDPELVKAVGAIRDLKTNIEKLQKDGKDSEKLTSQISTKATQCKTLVDTYGKGQLEIAECSAADSKSKITSTEVKTLCGTELNKAGADAAAGAAAAASKMKEICSDNVSALLQKIIDTAAKSTEISKLADAKDKAQKEKDLLKEKAQICKDLYPKMPDQCKSEVTRDSKKEISAFYLKDLKASCEIILAENKKTNGVDETLPERTDLTVEAGRVDEAVQDQRQIVLQKQKEREEAARKLNDAKVALEEKKSAKASADDAARKAKEESDAAPTDEDKKKNAEDKAAAAQKAGEEVALAEKAVRELGGTVEEIEKAAAEAARRAKDQAKKEKLTVELAGTFQAKVEKLQLEKADILIKVAPAAGEDASGKVTNPDTPILANGTVMTLKQLHEKQEKVACRVIKYASELKNGEVNLVNVTDEGTTDKTQGLTMYLKTKGDDGVLFSVRCGKLNAEQLTLEEVEKALGDVLKIVKKTAAPAPVKRPAEPATPPAAKPAASGGGGATQPNPAPVASVVDMFKGKVLKIDLKSFIVTDTEQLDENMATSKTIVSGFSSAGSGARVKISSEIASKNYNEGKTVCIFTGRGSKLSSTDLDNKKSELSHRIVKANFQKRTDKNEVHQSIRLQTAAVSTNSNVEMDLEQASGASFTCYKKGSVDMTVADIAQGLLGAVNSIE